MVLPKNAESIMGGSCLQLAGVAEGWRKAIDADKLKRQLRFLEKSDAGRGATERWPCGENLRKTEERKTEGLV